MNLDTKKAHHFITQNLAASLIATAIIFGGVGFYAGKSMGGSEAPGRQFGQNGFGSSQNTARRGPSGMNAVFGVITAKDASSITVSLGGPGATSTNGTAQGSRIIFFGGSTQITKSVSGTAADLSVGTMITANGTANTDGSVTASQIQIRTAQSGAPTR